MVWIHGGKFDSGCGTIDMIPDYLVHEEVIVITLNYRLGVFGFLSLQNENVPGNMGLKDQIMALKWIQDNISYFGGDRYKVTLFGTDAGAASIHYLMLSESTRYLFHKAILQSGSAYSPWAMQFQPFNRTRDFLFNLKLVSQCANKSEIRSKSYDFNSFTTKEIYDAAKNCIKQDDIDRQLTSIFVPVFEIVNSSDFLINDSIKNEMKKINNKKISWKPVIIGFNTAEGLELLANETNLEDSWYKDKTFLDKILPRDVYFTKYSSVDDEKMYKAIEDEYRQGYENDSYYQTYVKMKGDLWYTYPVYRTAVEMFNLTNKFKVYFYRFSDNSKIRNKNLRKKYETINGSNHGDELYFLFNQILFTNHPSQLATSKKIIKLWTRFAKIENPTTSHEWYEGELTLWNAIQKDKEPEYFDLGEFKMKPLNTSEYSRMRLWNKVYIAVEVRKSNKKKNNVTITLCASLE